ncbi:MAG: hypothetical protein PHZ19_09410 [Candidatus Thermoplasmatota archaeon]|nr:hypothetical protein [Candidatus Thermoplasmatota archaeon]
MRIPKRVKIGAHEYAVRWSEGMEAHGKCRKADGVILLDESIRGNAAETVDTFLHESLHALDFHAKLDLGEDRVHRLAFQLTAFLLENKLLRLDG